MQFRFSVCAALLILAGAGSLALAQADPAAAEGRGPLTGQIQLSEKALYLAEWQMYEAVDALAGVVAAKVPANATHLIITTDPSYAQSIAQARLLESSTAMWKAQLETMNSELNTSETAGEYCGKPAEAVDPAFSARSANAALSGLSNIAGFFQSDYALGTATPAANQTAWLAAVAGKIKAPVQQVRTQQFGSFAQNTLIKTVESLQSKSLANRQLIATLNGWLPAKDPKKKTPEGACIEGRRGLVARATTLQDRYDAFFASMTAPGEKGSASVLERAVSAGVLPDEKAHILITSIVSNGGIQSVRRNLWTSPRLAYVGGAVVTYSYLRQNGDVVASGIERAAEGLSLNVGKLNRGKSFRNSLQSHGQSNQ